MMRGRNKNISHVSLAWSSFALSLAVAALQARRLPLIAVQVPAFRGRCGSRIGPRPAGAHIGPSAVAGTGG